ncbi:MAG: hypothetical protein Q4C22_04195 [Bacillota bacterium]|nr:hypothetical protein [Bacillota bacterium]
MARIVNRRATAAATKAKNQASTPSIQEAYANVLSRQNASALPSTSTSQTTGSDYTFNGTDATTAWMNQNVDRIAGLSAAQGVDMGAAASMLISNLAGQTNYAGGGAIDSATQRALYQQYLAAQNTDKQSTVPQSATSGYSTTAPNAYYEQALTSLQQSEQAQREALERQQQATLESIYGTQSQVEQDYAQQQREAYIANQRSQAGMKDYLASMGYTGGMAESTLAGVQADYENQRAQADQQRNNALQEIQNLATQAMLTGDANLANLASQMYANYASFYQNAASAQTAQDQWQAEYDLQRQQYAYQQEQDTYANQLYAAQLAAEAGDYSMLNSLLGTNISPQVFTGYSGGGSSGSSGGSSSTNSSFTPSQIIALLENDLIDDATARQYLGLETAGTGTTGAIGSQSPGYQRLMLELSNYAFASGGKDPVGIEMKIVAGLRNGTITEAEARALAAQFAVTI